MKIKIYADGANKKDILYFNKQTDIAGLTTNPSLMRKSGVKNYKKFSIEILKKVVKKPISFEVFADDFSQMYKQCLLCFSFIIFRVCIFPNFFKTKIRILDMKIIFNRRVQFYASMYCFRP